MCFRNKQQRCKTMIVLHLCCLFSAIFLTRYFLTLS